MEKNHHEERVRHAEFTEEEYSYKKFPLSSFHAFCNIYS
jgi:hypothetical protein